MGSIIDRALDIINDHLKDQTSSFQVSSPLSAGKAMARGGHVLEDDYPTHYLPNVGRQVMAAGGMPEEPIGGALNVARSIPEEGASIPAPVAPRPPVSPFEGRVQSSKLAQTFAHENLPGTIVSPRPGKGYGPAITPEHGVKYDEPEYTGYGERGEEPSSHTEFSYATPDIGGMKLPPPVQHPVLNNPRMDRLTNSTAAIMKSKGFKDLFRDHVGLDPAKLKITPTVGSFRGELEPSFYIDHPDMQPEHAQKIGNLLGFGFQQDQTVRTSHNPNIQEGTLAALVGHGRKLSSEDIDNIMKSAEKEGLDFTVTKDGKAAKFLHFGGDEEYPDFLDKVGRIADSNKLKERYHARTEGSLIDAQDYLSGLFGGHSGGEGVQEGTGRSPDLFGRVVDHVLAPFAKAVAGEGYRLSPERLQEAYGLTDDETDKVRQSLLPTSKGDRTTVPLMTGEEQLDIRPTGAHGKSTVDDVLYALQNRAAQKGQIEPGDYSDEAKKLIANDIAKEVKYHVDNSSKSAIGWYDTALKKAKNVYHQIFPELKTNKDNELLFDALLGITSQGNDVYNNSVHAARLYDKIRNGASVKDATQSLRGTFGDKTRAIEQNLNKFHHLIETNGYDKMRDMFNQTKTVSEWRKILNSDPNMRGPNGEKLTVKGASDQKITGWSVFGPKIGSFINNLHGDYSTLTADLWFSRTWNRLLGHNFIHAPLNEQKQYQDFRDAFKQEFLHNNGFPFERIPYALEGGQPKYKTGKLVPWEHGRDTKGMTYGEFEDIYNDPDKLKDYAQGIYKKFSTATKGVPAFSEKSDLRRRAKNWMENRELSQAAPRGDSERSFQQNTVEEAQKLLKKKYGLNISVADIQAALWFHEKEMFGKFGVASERAKPADYEDAAAKTMELINKGDLYRVKSKEKTGKAFGGAITPIELGAGNFDDEARRLILWSYAAAPIVRPLSRAEGGPIDDPVDKALNIVGAGSSPASAVETARNLTPMGFYSAASEAASKIPQKAPIDQILNKIKGQPNVKAEELDLSGVRDAFSGQKSVDPKDVAAHLQENLPQIYESVYGYDSKSKRQTNMSPKYERYTFPGGQNYREVVLHDPFAEGSYQSPHWSDPNVIAHLRMADRGMYGFGDPEALHIEEVQSDWGQEGRDAGFREPFKPQSMSQWVKQKYPDRFYDAQRLEQKLSDERFPRLTNDEHELMQEYELSQNEDKSLPPRGPHVTSTESWTDLALKRALMEAAKGKYKKLTWTPGEDQADRYGLDKSYSQIHYSPDTKELFAKGKDGVEDIQERVHPDALHSFIGKELADKLLARPLLDNTQPGIKGDKIHSLIGGQLAVEQKGMRDYYDRMLPNRLQKLVSKLDPDAKVQLFGHKTWVPEDTWQHEDDDSEPGEYKKVHSLEITPKLRAAILKGLPAFEHGGAVVDRAFDVLSKLPR